jgi:hypothetical protein
MSYDACPDYGLAANDQTMLNAFDYIFTTWNRKEQYARRNTFPV